MKQVGLVLLSHSRFNHSCLFVEIFGKPQESKYWISSEDLICIGFNRPLASVLPNRLLKYPRKQHIVNRILNLHAPEWSGEVRDVKYSADGKYVSVVYRVTLYGTDAKIYRESTGTASVDDKISGDPVQKAESMAFRRACARLGLGLHLYHDDLS
ncbi:hypothetical protein MKW94_018020 [Papaver nudicaule]|uniref:DNA repair RAD52-like protein 1, mitochondrial n=1 Tax=Papaver nudicaule TaxID=74823 RepID=A0AA41S8X8_PAPNU|nr:hypothetical protein [Papaver nudicaule]